MCICLCKKSIVLVGQLSTSQNLPLIYISSTLLPGETRTCIHTPAVPLTADEITPEVLNQLLKGAELVYFDGRLTEAALVVAQEAKDRGIKVSNQTN